MVSVRLAIMMLTTITILAMMPTMVRIVTTMTILTMVRTMSMVSMVRMMSMVSTPVHPEVARHCVNTCSSIGVVEKETLAN